MSVTVIVTPDLIELNRRAVKANRNRSLVDEVYDLLDPDGIHVIAYSMLHNDEEIRVKLLMKFAGQEEPVEGWLDMDIADFNKLQVESTSDRRDAISDAEWDTLPASVRNVLDPASVEPTNDEDIDIDDLITHPLVLEPTDEYWWQEHDNLVLTAGYMLHQDYAPAAFVDFIEKPWKYTDLYEEARDYAAEEES